MLEEGVGVEKNYEKALEKYKEAASHNYLQAEYKILEFYYRGYAQPKSPEVVLELALKVAKEDHLDAICIVGNYYWQTKEYVDRQTAVTWWRKAAIKDWPRAMHNLGVSYMCGTYDGAQYVGEPNYNQATYWLEKSANMGHAMSQYELGKLLAVYSQNFEKKLKGIEYLEKAYNQGHKEAHEPILNNKVLCLLYQAQQFPHTFGSLSAELQAVIPFIVLYGMEHFPFDIVSTIVRHILFLHIPIQEEQ